MNNNIDISNMLNAIGNISNRTYELLDNSFANMGISDAELSSTRMTECTACQHYKNNTKQCDICGCFMPIKSKLLAAKCPIGTW